MPEPPQPDDRPKFCHENHAEKNSPSNTKEAVTQNIDALYLVTDVNLRRVTIWLISAAVDAGQPQSDCSACDRLQQEMWALPVVPGRGARMDDPLIHER